jgi:hypothetical protein
MGIQLQKDKQRIYFIGDTEGLRDKIRVLGGRYDFKRNQWWVSAVMQSEAVAMLIEAQSDKAPACAASLQVVGEVQRNGITYYVVSFADHGKRVRFVSAPDAEGRFRDFYAMPW